MDTNPSAQNMEPKSNTKLTVGIIVAIIVIIGGYFAIKGSPSTQQSTGPIKIGFIGPLTGDGASIGQSAKAAVEMAVEEINAQGGVNGNLIQVIYEDGKCNPKDSVNAGNKLINIDKVSAIIGGTCSSETSAVAPIAEQNKVPLISDCSSAPKITDAGDYIFRDYASDNFQGVYMADYIYNKVGLKKVATLYCLSDWCAGLKDTFDKKFKELGGEIVAVEGFEQTSRDLRSQLTKIKSSNPDGIYFVSYTEATIPGIKQLKELGIKAKVFGADAWDDAKIWGTLGKTADGTFYSVPTSASKEFQDKLTARTNSPVTTCASQAYDAAYIFANVMKKVGVNGEAVKNALYGVKDYQGVSGVISFDKNGDLENASYVIKTVKDGIATENTN